MKRYQLNAPQVWVILGVGLLAVAVAQVVGWCANALGANGALVGMPFAQAVIFGALFYHRHLGLPEIKWGGCIGQGFLLGVAAWVVSTILSGAFGWGLHELFRIDTQEQSAIARLRIAGRAEFAYIAVLAGFVAPICEEIYFRGWWLNFAAGKLKPLQANFLVALVFALLHGDWTLVPGLMLAGFLFGVAALRWGMVSAIAAHIVFNFITILAARGGWL